MSQYTVALQDTAPQVDTLTFKRFNALQGMPRVDTETGVVTCGDYFSAPGGYLRIGEVKCESAQKIIISYLAAAYTLDGKDATMHLYTFEIIEGVIHKSVESLPPPDWYEKSQDAYDLKKHPDNTFMHHVLPNSRNPVFEGQNIYITCDREWLLRYGDTWVKTDMKYVVSRLRDHADLRRDFFALELAGML